MTCPRCLTRLTTLYAIDVTGAQCMGCGNEIYNETTSLLPPKPYAYDPGDKGVWGDQRQRATRLRRTTHCKEGHKYTEAERAHADVVRCGICHAARTARYKRQKQETTR